MSTLAQAIAALIYVADQTVQGLTSDPTWGNLYTGTIFQDRMLLDTYDGTRVAIYDARGNAKAQGLGTIKQWQSDLVRVDIMVSDPADVRQIVQIVRTAWIADFNYTPVNAAGVVGQGYLRNPPVGSTPGGGIKYIRFISEPMGAPLEKRDFVRRFFDIEIRIGD